MHPIRFAFTLSLALLATGCYTQLRAPRAVHDDAAPPPARDDDATTSGEETAVPHVHTPVFVLPHYSYSDYWVHCGPYGWGIERYRRHGPWGYRCGLTDRYWWFSDYDWHRQVYGDYVPAFWHDVWPVRAYRPRSGRGPRFVPRHPEARRSRRGRRRPVPVQTPGVRRGRYDSRPEDRRDGGIPGARSKTPRRRGRWCPAGGQRDLPAGKTDPDGRRGVEAGSRIRPVERGARCRERRGRGPDRGTRGWERSSDPATRQAISGSQTRPGQACRIGTGMGGSGGEA